MTLASVGVGVWVHVYRKGGVFGGRDSNGWKGVDCMLADGPAGMGLGDSEACLLFFETTDPLFALHMGDEIAWHGTGTARA